jgi:hypothetical protein
MKKIVTLLIIALIGVAAYVTKPDDKTCIIKAVETVWGDKTPDKYHSRNTMSSLWMWPVKQ